MFFVKTQNSPAKSQNNGRKSNSKKVSWSMSKPPWPKQKQEENDLEIQLATARRKISNEEAEIAELYNLQDAPEKILEKTTWKSTESLSLPTPRPMRWSSS